MTLLAKLRGQKGLTQEELAAKAKLARATVQRIERGFPCEPATAKRLAGVLGVRWTVFFDDAAQERKRTS